MRGARATAALVAVVLFGGFSTVAGEREQPAPRPGLPVLHAEPDP